VAVDAWLYGVGFAICSVFLALSAGAEVAFAQLNGVRLRQLMQRGISRSQAIAEVVQDPAGLGAAIGITHLTSIAVAAGLTVHGVLMFALTPQSGAAILFGAGAVLLMVQTMGRGIGVVRPEAVATRLYGPVRVIAVVTGPLVKLDNMFVRATLRRLLGAIPEDHSSATEEDLRALVDVVDETEGLEREEREMITSIFEMSDRDVAEIMVPRLDMVSITSVKSITEALDLAVVSGHSRFPVIEDDLDHVLGVVHLRDLAGALRRSETDQPLSALVRPVHVVPETKKIDELLRDLQSMRTQMALVVDEYGGTAGLVTIEDLLEEIVGEIRDEYDTEEDPIQVLSDREAIMKATVSIHDANEALPMHLEDDEYETLAGLVYNELGRVPTPGDVVTLPGATIKVLTTIGRRVQRVHVTLQEDRGPPPTELPPTVV
jgi:putative hemolysin